MAHSGRGLVAKLYPVRVFVVPGQEKKIHKAVTEKTKLLLNVYRADHTGAKSHVLCLTERQISILRKGKGVYKLRMTAEQVVHNVRYKGGFLGLILASILGSAAAAAVGAAVEKKISGGSLTVKKGKKIFHIERRGEGLFLRPFRGRYFQQEGDGLFLRQPYGRGIHWKRVDSFRDITDRKLRNWLKKGLLYTPSTM